MSNTSNNDVSYISLRSQPVLEVIHPELAKGGKNAGCYAVRYMGVGWDIRPTFAEALRFARWQVDDYSMSKKAEVPVFAQICDQFGPLAQVERRLAIRED